MTPTGISDTLSAIVTLPAASIALLSGGAQSGTVGAALTSPAIVQVNAEDGAGVAGVAVTFAAPIGGSRRHGDRYDRRERARIDDDDACDDRRRPELRGDRRRLQCSHSGDGICRSGIAPRPRRSPRTSRASRPTTQRRRRSPCRRKTNTATRSTSGGAAVRLTTNLGHFGSIGAVTTIDATDLGNGKYSAQLFASHPGTATITGTIGGTAVAHDKQ